MTDTTSWPDHSVVAAVWARFTDIDADRGEGSWLIARDGTRYLDYTSGIGVTNTGHCHPRVVQAVQEQAGKLLHAQVNIIYHPPLLELVKELRAAEAADYTTGKGISHATDGLKQWFVMIKDTQGRFWQNRLWGDGWGWALYRPDNPAKNIATDYKTDCLGCHVPAEATDWVYTQAYPTLRTD